MQTEIQDKPYRLKIDPAGRVVIPVEIRNRLKVKPGRELFADLDQQGVLRLRTFEQIMAQLQKAYAPFKKPGESVTEEFIKERREEAGRE